MLNRNLIGLERNEYFVRPYLTFMNTKPHVYLTTLTPLRGIAALLVVIFHANLMLAQFMPVDITGLIDLGWLWVDFFFILSGFIMLYVYGTSFQNSVTLSNFKKYIGARFARVYPLNIFTMLIALALVLYIRAIADGLDPFFEDMFNLWGAPASVLFLQGMHLFSTAPLNTPSWSLSTEWWMYMLFPFFVPLFSRMKLPGKIITPLLLLIGYIILMYVIGPITGPFKGNYTLDIVSDFGFIRCALGFFLGMWIYILYDSKALYSFMRYDSVFLLLFCAILAAMHFRVHALVIVALFGFGILAAAYNQGSVKKALDTRPLQRLGDWSFSIYMVHILIIFCFWIIDLREDPKMFSDFMKLVTRPPDYHLGLVRLSILLPLTLVLSALTYYLVEIPSRNYLNKKFGKKISTPQA